MRILEFQDEPIQELPYLNAGRGPGGFYEAQLPIHTARVSHLPDDVDAVIATADLQGRERFADAPRGVPRLLGQALPQQLIERLLPRLGLMDPLRIGVFLAGDFFTVPTLDRRGGSGDVTPVWEAFGAAFAWTAGVAGNHDTFGDNRLAPTGLPRHLHYLDQDRVRLGGLSVAGLGGIIGNPRRPHRRSEDAYLKAVRDLLKQSTDVLICHEGPNDPSGQRGSARVREVVEESPPRLVVRGHAHWKRPFVELTGGVQVLNVDARVVFLLKQ